MQAASYLDPAQAQDNLRPVRNFVSLLAGAVNDQSWAGQDGYAVNMPGQVQVQGPNGVAVEGKPYVIASPAQAPGFPPLLLALGAVLVAHLMLK